MRDTQPTRIQQLRGGTKWHCPDVTCSYVDSADLELDGPTRDVTWDDDQHVLRAVEDDERIALSGVCNRCRHELGWRAPWITS